MPSNLQDVILEARLLRAEAVALRLGLEAQREALQAERVALRRNMAQIRTTLVRSQGVSETERERAKPVLCERPVFG